MSEWYTMSWNHPDRYGFAFLGVVTALYAFYNLVVHSSFVISFLALLTGGALIFTQIDRNVYKERVENLHQSIFNTGRSDINIDRFDHTEYEFRVGNDVGRSDEESENK